MALTTQPTPAARLDAARAVVQPGPGAVVRLPGLLCLMRLPQATDGGEPGPGQLARFVEICTENAAASPTAPGRPLARRLARWLGTLDPGPDFGTVAATEDGIAIFLHGGVDVVVGGERCSARESGAWLDRLFPYPAGPIVLLATGEPDPAPRGVFDMRGGVVPAGAVTLMPRSGTLPSVLATPAVRPCPGPVTEEPVAARRPSPTPRRAPAAPPPVPAEPVERAPGSPASVAPAAPVASPLPATPPAVATSPAAPPAVAPPVAPVASPARPLRRVSAILGVGPDEPPRPPLDAGAPRPSARPAGEAPSALVPPPDVAGAGDAPTLVAAPGEQPTVLADGPPMAYGHRCARDHLNDPRNHFCTVCGIRMSERTGVIEIGVRPPLGLLVFDDGSTYTVDADYLLGRTPETDPRVAGGQLRPLPVDDPEAEVSRGHLVIKVDGWDVTAVDESRNGTFMAGPGEREWSRLPPLRPLRLLPGTRVRVGGRCFVFESASGVR